MSDLPSAIERVKAVANGAAYDDVYGLEWCLEPAAAMRADLRAIVAALDGLDWWATQRGVSVEHRYDEPEDDGEWRAFRESGGVNDREWDVIGHGSTPLEAIQSAFLAKMGGAK